MSKSTPLSQLRAANPGMSDAMNVQAMISQQPTEQQKQMFSTMQQAQENFSYPQNTQASDIVVDDDVTVMDALNHLNGGTAGSQSMQMQNQSTEPMQMQEMMVPNDDEMQQMQMQNILNSMPESANTVAPQDIKQQIINDIFSWNDDMKTFIIVVAMYILITMLPIESFIY